MTAGISVWKQHFVRALFATLIERGPGIDDKGFLEGKHGNIKERS
jgi:hypothetical protein